MSNSTSAQAEAFNDLDHADDGSHPLAGDGPDDGYNPLHGRPYAYRTALTEKLLAALTSVGVECERPCNTYFTLPTSGRKVVTVQVNAHNVAVTTEDLAGGNYPSEDMLPRGLAVWEIVADLFKRAALLSSDAEADVPF